MQAGDININQGSITAKGDSNMFFLQQHGFSVATLIFLVTGLKINLILPVISQIVTVRGVCTKIGGAFYSFTS